MIGVFAVAIHGQTDIGRCHPGRLLKSLRNFPICFIYLFVIFKEIKRFIIRFHAVGARLYFNVI